MASIAFEDEKRKTQKYAHSCTINDLGKRYYCWNMNCSARLYVRALNSALNTHFYTPDSHEELCRGYQLNFNPTDYCESDFNFISVINNILSDFENPKPKTKPKSKKQKKGDGKTIPYSRVRQIYDMCKSHHPESEYNGFKIWSMLFDSRCNKRLTKGIFNEHLVECFFKRYENDSQRILLKYPLDETLKNKYSLYINIKDTQLYYDLRKKLFNKKKLPIVIAGDWRRVKESFNFFQCDVNSGRQIFLPCQRKTDI